MSLGTSDRIYYINHSLETDREGVIFQKYCYFHLFIHLLFPALFVTKIGKTR